MMQSSVLLLLLAFLVSVQAIHVITPFDEEVYSGPGGAPAIGWDTVVDPVGYSSYESVAQFLFTSTREDDFYGREHREVIEVPTISIESGDNIISPILFGSVAEGYTFEQDEYWEDLPELNVYFNCKEEGRAVVSVSIKTTFHFLDDDKAEPIEETIQFFFQKECFAAFGNRDGFSVQAEGKPDPVKHGIAQQRWIMESYEFLDKNPIVVDGNEHMTLFYIAMESPSYGNQFFHEPEVFVEDDDLLEVLIRGNANHGGIATASAESLTLFYDCNGQGDTEVTVSIDLGFFGVVEFGFSKTCSLEGKDEDMPGTINLGISRSDFAGIIFESTTSMLWRADMPTVLIESSEISTNFYISTQSGKEQEILAPVVTVHPSTAFAYTLSGTLRSGGIVVGSPQHFTINYICDRVTEADITISIKMPHEKTIDFAYTKQCKALKRHTDQVWTANQLMVTFIFFAIALSFGLFVLYKKQNTQKTQRKNVV